MHRLTVIAALGFFGFIGWIVYLADTGGSSVFFDLVHAIPLGDKIGHFVLYGLLALLANFALKLRVARVASMRMYWGAALVALFAVAEEFSQAMFPRRTFDLQDLLADALGILAFSLLTHLMVRRRGALSAP